ncbi:MAG: FHA domain-containing protein [Bacteriovorax sp.]|nr:FHA domain-containing protein [Bacteriovorax sp.]
MAIVLLVTTADGKTVELPVFGEFSIGRSSSCDLVLDDKQMSSKHGSFELNQKGELIYTDLGSTNGSYLNNSQVHQIQFKINETLRLGNTSIIIDSKRLNAREQLSIGKGLSPSDDLNTIVLPSSKSIPDKKLTDKKSWEDKMLKLDVNKHKKK